MRTVPASVLNETYMRLYPGEVSPANAADSERILQNWLDRYEKDPVDAVSLVNWHGKVTRALLRSLGLPSSPKTKRAALFMLAGK